MDRLRRWYARFWEVGGGDLVICSRNWSRSQTVATYWPVKTP